MKKLYKEIKVFNTITMPENIKENFMSFHKGSPLNVYFEYLIGYNDSADKRKLNQWFIDNGAHDSELVLVYYDYPRY